MFTPLYWLIICLLLIIFIRQKRWKKIFGFAAAVIFILFSNPILFELYARWWQPKPIEIPSNTHYTFAIVAGGFASVDKEGGGYFNGASDRFLQAVKLYHTGSVDNILISGGNSKKNDKSFTEAAWAKGEMKKMGVPDVAVIIEDASNNTKSNAINSKNILDSIKAAPPYVLITSAYHMPRAKKIFINEGMEVIAYPCNYTEGRGPITFSGMIPDAALLVYWNRYIRETLWWIVRG